MSHGASIDDAGLTGHQDHRNISCSRLVHGGSIRTAERMQKRKRIKQSLMRTSKRLTVVVVDLLYSNMLACWA